MMTFIARMQVKPGKEAEFEDGELKTEYGFSGVLAGFNFRF